MNVGNGVRTVHGIAAYAECSIGPPVGAAQCPERDRFSSSESSQLRRRLDGDRYRPDAELVFNDLPPEVGQVHALVCRVQQGQLRRRRHQFHCEPRRCSTVGKPPT
jgi:hypothetical protein